MSLGTTTTVVSGLPRSGTSMMMQMLVAGGLPALTDSLRSPDADNPRGYYEHEAVKALARDATFLLHAHGQAVKIVSALLPHLPEEFECRVIFMHRPMPEILASQRTMLERLGRTAGLADDARLGELFTRHLHEVDGLLRSRPTIDRLDIAYREVIRAPLLVAERVNEFLGGTLDPLRMAAAVAPELHRRR